MKESFSISDARHGERGAARARFIITLLIVAVLVYMGIQFVPVWYRDMRYKDYLQESASNVAASSLPLDQKPPSLTERVRKGGSDYGVPSDAKITSTTLDNRLNVTVEFPRQINLLPGFSINYDFKYTAKSDPLLN
jgi:hypothetical protein